MVDKRDGRGDRGGGGRGGGRRGNRGGGRGRDRGGSPVSSSSSSSTPATPATPPHGSSRGGGAAGRQPRTPPTNDRNQTVPSSPSGSPSTDASKRLYTLTVRLQLATDPSQHEMRQFLVACHEFLVEPLRVLDLLVGEPRKGGERCINQFLGCSACMSVQSGSHPSLISFQRVIIPLMQVIVGIAHRCDGMPELNALRSRFLGASDFMQDACRCVSELASQSLPWQEASVPERDIAPWFASDGAAAVLVLIEFLTFLNRNRQMPELLGEPCQQLVMVELNNLLNRQTLSTTNEREALEHLQRQLYPKLFDAPQPRTRLVSSSRTQVARPRRLLQFDDINDGPGAARIERVPRHDNDHEVYTDIRIVPTAGELLSENRPWLPRNSSDAHHILELGTQERHLDTHFRLMRHDLVGPLTEAIASVFHDGNASWRSLGSGACAARGASANLFVYRDVQLEHTASKPTAGLHASLQISFEAPKRLASEHSEKKRCELWERSKRLSLESLIVLYSPVRRALWVGVVSLRDAKLLAHTRPQLGVSLVSENDDSMEQEFDALLNVFQRHSNRHDENEVLLLSASGALFASYGPVLRALQKLGDRPLPLRQFILPGQEAVTGNHLPSYLQRLDRLDFTSILKPGAPRSMLGSWSIGSPDFPLDYLKQHSILDEGQVESLYSMLTQQCCLVQGPPGTGKSYLGVHFVRLLLANKCPQGPILCVCYTNHALDQFLELLLEHKEKGIVRIGGRSKSEKLDQYNLHMLSRGKLSRSEYAKLCQHRDVADECLKELQLEIARLSNLLQSAPSWGALCDTATLLDQPLVDDLLFSLNATEDGFKVATGGKRHATPASAFNSWLGGHPSPFKAKKLRNSIPHPECWRWPLADRQAKIQEWIMLAREASSMQVQALLSRYSEAKRAIQVLDRSGQLQVLSSARIVGMTTTGVAKHHELVRALRAPLVLCEEAAEVLEAHILSCLTSGVQHLVMIGDHQQLRPKCETYELSAASGRGLDLDLSMFERLAVSNHRTRVRSLCVQRRMHPEISCLIRETLYPHLIDDPKTSEHPSPRGMVNRVHFVAHNQPEAGDGDDKDSLDTGSKFNVHEATLVAAIAKYLLQQGVYKEREITILTPYLGQLRCITAEMRKLRLVVRLDKRDKRDLRKLREQTGEDVSDSDDDDDDSDSDSDDSDDDLLKDSKRRTGERPRTKTVSLSERVRISTVDNFQGEESEVIIISLVRSKKVGFLNSANRINVLLSRAKHGMYLVGNEDVLRRAPVPMWHSVLDILRERGQLSDSLAIRCALHPETVAHVRSAKDFSNFAPDGGCSQPCRDRMPCGHPCARMCHPDDRRHVKTSCGARCERPRACGHACPKLCHQECGPCLVRKTITMPVCGHHRTVLCHQEQEALKGSCSANVRVIAPCGHEQTVSCAAARSRDHSRYPRCTAESSHRLEACGHPCSLSCHDCSHAKAGTGAHPPCAQACQRILFCGHQCSRLCHGSTPCGDCMLPCSNQCGHSVCNKKCHELCYPCVLQCQWECPHQGRCQQKCNEPCRRRLCDQRCPKALKCGHQCPTVCGERCPTSSDYCPVCSKSDSIRNCRVDLIELETFAENFAKEQPKPVVILPCNHILVLESFDQIVKLSKVYDEQGEPKQLPLDQHQLFQCPDCRTVISGVLRAGRAINAVTILAEHQRFQHKCAQSITKLYEQHLSASALGRAIDVDGILKGIAQLRALQAQAPLANLPEIRVQDTPIGVHNVWRTRPMAMSLQLGALLLSRIASRKPGLEEVVHLVNLSCDHTTEFRVVRDLCIATRSFSSLADLILSYSHLMKWALMATESFHQDNDRTALRNQLLNRMQRVVECLPAGCSADSSSSMREARRVLREAEERFNNTISQNEIREVYNAIGLHNPGWNNQGHWFECPNGHVYVIGECGGAMEASRCPECGEQIGGTQHATVPSNRPATQFIAAATATTPTTPLRR